MPRSPGGSRGKPAHRNPKKPNAPKRGNADALLADLIRRMEACPNAESLNDEVLMPFVLALEKVCGARGYVMNIYGETANLVFTNDPEDAEAIYQIVEAYLEDQAEDD